MDQSGQVELTWEWTRNDAVHCSYRTAQGSSIQSMSRAVLPETKPTCAHSTGTRGCTFKLQHEYDTLDIDSNLLVAAFDLLPLTCINQQPIIVQHAASVHAIKFHIYFQSPCVPT